MAIHCTHENRRLTALISGELDHHSAKHIMTELERAVDTALPRELILELSGLTFTDSSGIAVLLRARRHMERLGGTLRVTRVPPQADKVFRAAGLQQLIPFE